MRENQIHYIKTRGIKTKFKEGDKVRIINYGSWLMVDKFTKVDFPIIKEYSDYKLVDPLPELVGKVGVIDKVNITNCKAHYSIDLGTNRISWFSDNQLELIGNE